MQLGVSTSCYYPRTTEDSLRILLDAGVKTIEVFFNSHSELEPLFLMQLRTMANDAGAQIVSVHPYTSGMEGILFFSDYDRRFADARGYYKRYYQAANILGAKTVVFHGGYKHQTMTVEEYARRIALLDADACQAGVCLAQENVERNLSRSPDFLRQLAQLCPQQHFVFDLKQAIRAEQDPYKVLAAMGNRVVHLHLSDHLPGYDCLPPGMGSTDYAALIAQAKAQGFAGSAVIELYRQNFEGQQQLDEGLKYLKTFL